MIFVISGHSFLRGNASVTILRNDLVSAYQENNYLPVWTFNTSEDYRIRFTFHEFSFYWSNYDYNLLDIGDGIVQIDTSKLATFGGRDLPSDVISVSNAAWLKVNEPCII